MMSRAGAPPENRSFNHTTASVFVLARQASQQQASPFPSDLSNRPIPIDLGPEGPEINTSAGLSGSPAGLGLWELSRMFPGSWTWELGGLSQSELTLLVGLTATAVCDRSDCCLSANRGPPLPVRNSKYVIAREYWSVFCEGRWLIHSGAI